MSLTIRIRSLYQENSISLSKSILSNAKDQNLIQNLNLIPASKYGLIECHLKIYFINSNGKKINLTKQRFNETNSQNRIAFKLDNNPIKFGDKLEILCFKSDKFLTKPFAKYTMLLDFLLSNKDDLCAQSKIHIDDYLSEPTTNKALKKKISFDVCYETEQTNSVQQDFDSEIYSFQNNSCNMVNHPLNQSTASDYIRSVLKTGEFALNKFNLTENDFSYSRKLGIYVSDLTDESVRSWLQDVNQCPSTLNLALNLVMSYELNNEQKDRFKKSVIKNNLSNILNESFYTNEIYLPNLLSQIFYTQWGAENICSWQIRVRIIELKLLLGLEETVYCIVEIGDQKYRTKDKSISNLNYTDDDETFITRIECKQYQKAFNYKISISVYFKKFIYSDQFVGKFEVDFGTIYLLPGHEAHHKWGELFYINDKSDSIDEGIFNSEMVSRGFVKFDIILQSKGDIAKIHYDDYKSDDNDEMQNNILVPYGLTGPTQLLKLVINIYSAQILEQKDTSIIDAVKKLFGQKQNENMSQVEQVSLLLFNDDEPKSKLNPFIRVSFGGLTKKSPCIQGKKSPEWNHSIEFIFRYPVLVRLIKIELCTEDKSGVRVLAKEYLALSDISSYQNDFSYLPTYGPSYIDLYNEPNNMRIKKFNSSKNEDNFNSMVNDLSSNSYTPLEASGSHYVARLLMGISSSLIMDSFGLVKKPSHFKVPPVTEFVCFIIIDECTMIDSRYMNGMINFQLCIGTNGHEEAGCDNETEPVEPIQLTSTMPIYLSYERAKPCLCLRFRSEDMRHIMFKINFIEKKLSQLSEIYEQIKNILWLKNFDSNDLKKANNLYESFLYTINRLKEFIKLEFLKKSFITQFNKCRIKQIKMELNNLADVINLLFRLTHKFRQSKSNESFKFYIDLIIRNTVIKMKKHLEEPLSYFPDVNLWFLFNRQKIGVCNMICKDVVWSDEEDKCGCISAKKVYTDVKSLKTVDFEDPERQNLARIKMFAWMGTIDEVNSVLIEKISSSNYEFDPKNVNGLALPKSVYFGEQHEFQLNVYLYQGRDMLLLDIAGESDPFARISLYNQSVYSKTIDNTVNPTWNQELVISQVFLYGNFEEILQKPPELIVDIFDEDPLNQKEFMGRVYVEPLMNTDTVSPPKLKWYKLFHNHSRAGDILASFELIHLKEGKIKPSAARAIINFNLIESVSYAFGFWNKRRQEIPKSITPKTRPYVFEIFYWGLRNIQETNYITFGQQKICVQIQIGDQVLDPNIIEKCATNSNFSITHRRYEIQLPEEDEYKPHLNIRCECYGSLFLYTSVHKELQTIEKQFSRKILIGSCTIKSIGNYCYDNDKLRNYFRAKDINRNFIHSISLDDSLHRENLTLGRFKKDIRKKKVVDFEANLDLDYLDWWSKYFTSITNEQKKSGSDKEDTGEDEMALEMTVPKKKRHDRRGSFISLKQKISMQNEIKRKVVDNRKIQKIKVFDCELEKKFNLNETFNKFSLIIGKNRTIINQDRIQCLFKGKFMLYDEKNLSEDVAQYLSMNGGFLKRMPPNLPVKLKVYLYIVKVSIVNPLHLVGKFEPFICIQNGEKQIEEKFKNDSIEPLIGKCFELETNFPEQSQLTISIKNWNFLEGTDLIGETTIDLEDRLYSKCYATCGLPKKFDLSGYNAWRDCILPKELLFKMCRKFGLLKPSFNNSRLIVYDFKDHPVFFPSNPEKQPPEVSQDSESDDDDNEEFKIVKINKYEQQLALDALNNWKKIANVELVPEHVETRSLYNPEAGPELEQGKVQMWIDMFPMGSFKASSIPKPVDVMLRKPKKFQLRVIIRRTRNVILDDTNPITGEKKSDIYIKGFLCDQEKVNQTTDVHYNSFNGSGEFNWRFVFDFEYLPAEKKIVFSQRQKFGLSVIESKSRPIVNLHCYDADNFSSDDLLGTLELDMSKFVQGANSTESCSLRMKNDHKWPKVNLFKRKFCKGWWPFEAIDGTLAGKLEAEFQVLSEKEAETSPAGRGREPPQPLETPERPETSFLWFTKPYQTFKFVIWKNYWKTIILSAFICIFIFGFIVFIIQLPSAIVNKVLG